MNPKSRMIWLSMPALTKTIATSRKEAHIRAILARCNAPTLRVTVPSAVGNGTGCGAQRVYVQRKATAPVDYYGA
jgi:hypothetical protein